MTFKEEYKHQACWRKVVVEVQDVLERTERKWRWRSDRRRHKAAMPPKKMVEGVIGRTESSGVKAKQKDTQELLEFGDADDYGNQGFMLNDEDRVPISSEDDENT